MIRQTKHRARVSLYALSTALIALGTASLSGLPAPANAQQSGGQQPIPVPITVCPGSPASNPGPQIGNPGTGLLPASLPATGACNLNPAASPADLTRAALRRAWSADPTIRDFIGLSENSWDFNAPGGVPGFGSLKAEDARRLLARVMGGTEAIDPARPTDERISDDQALVLSSEAGEQPRIK